MTQWRRAQQLFDQLNSHALTGDGAQISTGVHVSEGVITGFRNQHGVFGFFIPITQEEFTKFKPDRRSPAIQLTRALEEVEDGITRPYARLALLEPLHRKIFSVFADELLSELSMNPDRPAEKTGSMLQRWRRLFTTTNTPPEFGQEKQIGLLCELEVLISLIEEMGSEAIATWTGPESTPHDFELARESIECKAITSQNGIRVGINGAPQLTATQGKSLTLVVRRYIYDPDGKLSVPDLFRRIYENHEIPIDEFIAKLEKIGCPIFHPNSESLFQRFNVDLGVEFDVSNNFPRITTLGLDTRISDLQYMLDLSGPEFFPGFQRNNRYLKEQEYS